jgi:hypothetical protein
MIEWGGSSEEAGNVRRGKDNGKKIARTFSLTPETVEFLDAVDRKSALIEILLGGYQKGRFIREETAELLRKYKALFGVDPEEALTKILTKRISKIEFNMNAIKTLAPEEVKNRVGGSFLKLNRMYEEIVAENEGAKNKNAITFNILFKRTGCNNLSIRKWIRANKERLDAYHLSIGITDPGNHNRLLGVMKRVIRLKKERKKVEKDKANEEMKQEERLNAKITHDGKMTPKSGKQNVKKEKAKKGSQEVGKNG